MKLAKNFCHLTFLLFCPLNLSLASNLKLLSNNGKISISQQSCLSNNKNNSENYETLLVADQPTIGKSVSLISNSNIEAGLTSLISINSYQDIIFYDAFPTHNEKQKTTQVECKITVKSLTNTEISTTSIKYRISNSGLEETNFKSWRSGAIMLSSSSRSEITFQASIPNSYGDEFKEGENNYIQWFCEDNYCNKKISEAYKIEILENYKPKIHIIQPKGDLENLPGIPSNFTVVEASVTNKWSIDENLTKLKIQKFRTNETILEVSGSSLWSTNENKIIYKLNNEILKDNEIYAITLQVTDKNGVSATKTTNFSIKTKQIITLIPYPSPFDPQKEKITFRYELREESIITINIYTISSHLLKTVVDSVLRPAGTNEDKWDGINYADKVMANGVYICELICKNNSGEHRYYTSFGILRK